MALDRLTKVDGSGISTTSDYRVGIITASKFVGPIEGDVTGSITATDGTFSGNVTIGGTLTYEDVTNIDSVGIITARLGIQIPNDTYKLRAGTDLEMQVFHNGTNSIIKDTRNSGKVRIQADNFDIRDKDDSQTMIAAGVDGSVSLSHSGNQRIQTTSTGANVTGTVVATGADINGDIDVDGHTNLDNISIAGVTTTTGNIHLNSGAKIGFATDSNTFIGQDDYDRLDFNVGGKRLASIVEGTNIPVLVIDKDGVNNARSNQNTNYNANPHATELVLGNTSSNNHGMTIVSPSSGYGSIQFSDGSGGGLDATRGSIVFTHSDNKLNLKSKIGSIALTHKDDEKLATTDAGISILKDLDVDGHTNLDNVSVAGITTFSDRIIGSNSASTVPTAKFTNSGTGNQLELYGSATSTILIKATNNNGTPKLQLRDNYNRDNFISVTDSGDNLVLAVDEGNAGADSTMQFRVDGSEKLRISSVGHLGVGDDNPDTRLSVKAASGTDVVGKFTSTDANAWIQFRDNTTTDTAVMVGANGNNLLFRAGSNTRWKIDSSGHFVPNTAGAVNIGSSSAEIGDVFIADNKKAYFGSDQDFQVSHNGTHAVVKETTGRLYVLSDNLWFKNQADNSTTARFLNGDSVLLYYNGDPKLQTLSNGITVTGKVIASEEIEAAQDYPNIQPTLDFNFAATKKLDARISFYRTKIGSYIDENGDYRWASANEPKFNHDEVTHESKGLLIEPERTNKLTNGNNIDYGTNSGGSPGPSLDANNVEAPDGSFTARRIDYSNASGNMNSANSEYSWGDNAPAGKTYSASVWVKGIQGQTINMYLDASGQGSGNLNEAKITRTLTGKWQRMSVYYTYPSGANAAVLRIGTRNLHGLGEGTATIVSLWGVTVVEESRPGSTIATPLADTTTAADYALIDGEDFTEFFNQVEGTIISSTDSLDPAAVQYPLVIEGDVTNNERHILAEAGAYQYQIKDGGSTVAQIDAGSVNITKNIIAAAYKLNDAAVTINGSDPVADTSATMPTCTKLKLGHWSSTNYFGHISRFMYYRSKVANTQLKTLSSQ